MPNALPDGLVWLDAEPRPAAGEVLALLVTRNEALRLPACLAHLRALGVDRAFVLDNGSIDETRAIAAATPWVHLMDAPGSYAASGYGISWTNAVLDAYAQGHWVLVVDADELLAYPGSEAAGLHAFCAHLDGIGAEALPTILLDCFPAGRLGDVGYQPGAPLAEAAPFFEPPRLRREPVEAFPYALEYGGIRERLFFPEVAPDRLARRLHQKAWNLATRLGLARPAWAPRRSPTLTKLPLIRWREGAALLASTHQLAPMRLVPGQPTGVLLHYKFLQDFHARAVDAVQRGAHYDGSREYRRYLAALEADPGFSLRGPDSLRYQGPEQLVALGLMQDSPAWLAARRLPVADEAGIMRAST